MTWRARPAFKMGTRGRRRGVRWPGAAEKRCSWFLSATVVRDDGERLLITPSDDGCEQPLFLADDLRSVSFTVAHGDLVPVVTQT